MHTKLIFCVAFLLSTTSLSETNSEVVVVSTTPRHSQLDDLATQVVNLQKSVNMISNQLKALQTKTGPDKKKYDDLKDCKEIQQRGYNVSNFYYIKPSLAPQPFLVLCDMKTREGGWTHILNRFDGSQSFDLNWKEYKHGFGNIGGEFWVGLDKLYYLTGHQVHELLIELEDWNSKKAYALYNSFSVGSEDQGYAVKLLEGYSGDAGDSFSYHAGRKFSTKDNNQDKTSCASDKGAGWWYNVCTHSLLTGKYFNKTQAVPHCKGIYWITFGGYDSSFKQARMMIRPRNNDKSIHIHATRK